MKMFMRRRLLGAVSAFALVTAGLGGLASSANADGLTGAAFTTVNTAADATNHCLNGSGDINCNVYDGKDYVWLNGGPVAASLPNGSYFFAVLEPGGQPDPNDGGVKNLSSDLRSDRSFSVTDSGITYNGTHTFDFDHSKIRLMPYADTSNSGGVYILAICSLAGVDPVDPSRCKYDAFRIRAAGPIPPASDLAVVKTAVGAYTKTYGWDIQKSVDKTQVTQVGGNATFTYTVTVSHGQAVVSDVKVTGVITVYNLNSAPVTGVVVTDQLSDGTVCPVTGGSVTVQPGATNFAYLCTLSAVPGTSINNTATASWPSQTVSDASLVGSSADFTFTGVPFDPKSVDNCVAVTDVFNGVTSTLNPAACVGDSTLPPYTTTVPIPTYGCRTYNNTATFTTNTTGTTGSGNQSVQVCGPTRTGALTMGFWQNKNGQGIIMNGSAPGAVCNSGTWLRTYAPFAGLPGTTCKAVASSVYDVIKKANASGATMNAMLKGQMLATSLDVYFSDPALGGNKIGAPASIGDVSINTAKICSNPLTCSVYVDSSSVFGATTASPAKTVHQMLTNAASQSDAGGFTWYGQVKATQELAKDAFDAINNQVAFAG